MLTSICVFCGSSSNAKGEYFRAARELGGLFARNRIRLVYGGSRIGLMGAVANACLAEGGQVTGVIPQLLVDKEVAHAGLADLRVVESMQERKSVMNDLSDGFIAMPGGFGTLDELFEMLVSSQLGLHGKPCGLLNINNYYDPLLALCDNAVSEGFLHPAHRAIIFAEPSPEILLGHMESFVPPEVGKWWKSR